MDDISHRTIELNGIRIHIAEQGWVPWFSLPRLARVLVFLAASIEGACRGGISRHGPDMRGYGQTERPEAIDKYTLFHLVGDMVGLLDALGVQQAVIAGHDWALRLPGMRLYCGQTGFAA